MIVFFLSLILVPIITYFFVRARYPHFRWTIATITFGLIAYPFFVGLSVSLLYTGIPIGRIPSEVMLFHRSPGQDLVRVIVEHRRLVGIENIWVYVINAIHWGIIYGLFGKYFDRASIRNRAWIPLLLLIIPALVYTIPYSKKRIESVVWQKNNPSGVVCFQLMKTPFNTRVYFDTGSPPKNRLRRFGRGLTGSQPHCRNYGLSLSPLTVQFYTATKNNKRNLRATSGDIASEPLTINIIEKGRTCIGVFSEYLKPPMKWSANIVDCTLTHMSRSRVNRHKQSFSVK